MYAITMGGLFWSVDCGFTTRENADQFETQEEAIEAAQEDANLSPEAPWTVSRVGGEG